MLIVDVKIDLALIGTGEVPVDVALQAIVGPEPEAISGAPISVV
jgi:hypothetical protein